MNKILTYLIAITMYVFTADAFAQKSEDSINKAIECFKENLNHKNTGVVKSSIQNIMRLKVAYPDMDYSNVCKKLETLSVKSDKKLIRDMAYVAADLIKHPEQFQWNLSTEYDDLKDFFDAYELRSDQLIAQTY